MFARIKKSGRDEYLQIVHNERIDGRVRQRVIATLGRLDVLRENDQLDGLVESLARFSDHLAVLQAVRGDEAVAEAAVHVGPTLVFGKLWEQLGLPEILNHSARGGCAAIRSSS